MEINEELPQLQTLAAGFDKDFIMTTFPAVLDVVMEKVKRGATENEAIKAAKSVTKTTLTAFVSVKKPVVKTTEYRRPSTSGFVVGALSELHQIPHTVLKACLNIFLDLACPLL